MTDSRHDITAIESIRERADVLFDASAVDRAVDQLSLRLAVDLGESNPIVMCVMTGGIVLTAELLLRFDFPLELDYLHVTRYGGDTQGGDLNWRGGPVMDVRERTVLIVDDILDHGHTLEAVVLRLRELGAAEVLSAVLVEKEMDRPKRALADYVALKCPDRYVFGRGMDYKGYWRNLRGIYAVAHDTVAS